jgi:short-subunit dehydrogenase
MTQALRSELKDRGIEVIGAYPALVDTEMVAAIPMPKTPPEEVAAQILDGVQSGKNVIWPDPVSESAGGTYLENPIVFEEMLATF